MNQVGDHLAGHVSFTEKILLPFTSRSPGAAGLTPLLVVDTVVVSIVLGKGLSILLLPNPEFRGQKKGCVNAGLVTTAPEGERTSFHRGEN